MRQLAGSLLRAIATFGVAAFLTAVGSILVGESPPDSDDPYVIGFAVGAFVGGALFIALVFEQFLGKKTAALVYRGIYAVLILYTVYLVAYGELHGPGIALLFFGASVLFASLELFLFRRIRLSYFGPVGSALATIVLAALLLTY